MLLVVTVPIWDHGGSRAADRSLSGNLPWACHNLYQVIGGVRFDGEPQSFVKGGLNGMVYLCLLHPVHDMAGAQEKVERAMCTCRGAMRRLLGRNQEGVGLFTEFRPERKDRLGIRVEISSDDPRAAEGDNGREGLPEDG